jgi:hypothetical protein
MRVRTIGNALVGAGAIVGVATVTAIATGYEIRLSPEMIQLLTYKALGAAAIGLIVVGAWIGRGGTDMLREHSEKTEQDKNDLSEAPAALSEGSATDVKVRPGERQNSEL